MTRGRSWGSTASRRRKSLTPVRGGQTLARVPALAALLDAKIARGEAAQDVAGVVMVPGQATGGMRGVAGRATACMDNPAP